MRRIVILVIVIALTAVFMSGEKKAVVRDFVNPEYLDIGKDRMYVTEDIKVFIYSLKDFTLLKTFGKAGEGPKEFLRSPMPVRSSLRMVVCPDRLMINSLGKISFYSLDGEFQNLVRIQRPMPRYRPVRDDRFDIYSGFSTTIENKTIFIDVTLFDANLNIVKSLYRFNHFYQHGKGVDPVLGGIDYFDRVFTCNGTIIVVGEDNRLHLFDHNGKPLKKLPLPLEPVKMTDELQKKYDDFYMTDKRIKPLYQQDRHMVKFSDYLPLVRRMFFDKGRLYVVSFNRKDGKSEVLVIDLEGTVYKKGFLPIREQSIHALYPLDIKNGKIYQLIENNSEQWELHVTNI